MRGSCGICTPFDLGSGAEIAAAPSTDEKVTAANDQEISLNGLDTNARSEGVVVEFITPVKEEGNQAPSFPKTPKTIVDEAEARDDPAGCDERDEECVELPQKSLSSPIFADNVVDKTKVSDDAFELNDSENQFRANFTNPPTDKTLHVELDFDSNPSELYMLLQRREWDAAVARAQEHPDEVTHWVSRKEVDGKLRWRLLPLHSAIIFGAPDMVVKSLLDVYPGCVAAKDDQGMLPIHLSYRMGSSEGVVEALLTAFPKSTEIQDGKGRTPLVLAQTTKSPNRQAFIKALERHAQATSISSDSHAKILAGQRVEFEEMIAMIRQQHQQELNEGKLERDRLMKEISRLKDELKSSEFRYQEKQARVVLLETRLECKSVGETSVASKVTAMESCLKATVKAKEELEGRLTSENKALNEENEGLKTKCSTLEAEISKLSSMLEEETKKLESDITRLEIKLAGKAEKLKNLTEDQKSSKSYIAILEEQLKKKTAHENSLVEQVSSLARQLSVATQDNDSATANYTSRLRAIESEREALRQTVSKLSKKLLTVAEYLESVATEQASIIQKVQEHELDVQTAHEEHEKIAQSVKAQQELFEQCRKDRERISQYLRWEHVALQQSDEARSGVLEAVEKHAVQVKEISKTKVEIVQGANMMREQLQAILDSVNNYIPTAVDQEDANFVDKVLKIVLSASDSDDEDILKGHITPSHVVTGEDGLESTEEEGNSEDKASLAAKEIAEQLDTVGEKDVETVSEHAAAEEEFVTVQEETELLAAVPESRDHGHEMEVLPCPSSAQQASPNVSLDSEDGLKEVESSPSDEPAAISPKRKTYSFYLPVEIDINAEHENEFETTVIG